jgi:hypothetical protein
MKCLEIILRCEPTDRTLTDLYLRLVALPHTPKGLRIVTGPQLMSMHANGLPALRAMRNEGCIEFKEVTVREERSPRAPPTPKPARPPARPTPKRPSVLPSPGGF